MARAERFEEMEIWKDARELCKLIFKLTDSDDWKTDFRFRSQIRASSGSIMDNIAEGFERGGNKEFIQFLYIAKGSCGETRSQVHRALDCHFINEEQYNLLVETTIQLSRKIYRIISYLKTTELKGSKNH